MPKNFEIYSKRVDKTEGYGVQYNITKSWDTGVEGNIVITNTSAAPIEAWTLSFDSNFTIDTLWNGRVLENNGTSYTVAAEMWTNPVQPNSSMTIGFVGSKAADVEALLSNFRLTDVVIGEGMPIIPIDPPAEEIKITANAVYDEESGNISVLWTSDKQDGTFDILMSEDGENFVSVGTVEGVSEFVYTPENDFETLYFKVVQTVDEQTAESNLLIVTKTDEEIDWNDETDTDNDGITDVYEKYYYKTDPKNPDTDGDGLPDGYEVYTLGTDPLKVDSDDNGVSDADEDFDKDDLKNITEYELKTNPLYFDSDNDGISDGDELNLYNTNPLNPDSDGDFVSDGDEILLGLDPKNTNTNGYPDSEYTTQQVITQDSGSLYLINNNESNPYKVSMELKVAGVAENNLTSFISEYDYDIRKNDAVLGLVPEFVYNDNLLVEDVIIKFNINSETSSTDSNFISGIKRFNIFRYYEGYNILVPIETLYDEQNNIAYAHTNKLGVYCLIDMEIWLDNQGVSISNNTLKSGSVRQFNMNDSYLLSNKESAEGSVNNFQNISNETIGIIMTGGLYNGENDTIIYNQDGYIANSNALVLSEELTDDSNPIVKSMSRSISISEKSSDMAGIELIFFPTYSDNYFEYPEFVLNNSKEIFSKYKNVKVYVINYDGTLVKTDSGKDYAMKYSQVKRMAAKLNNDTLYDYSNVVNTYNKINLKTSTAKPNISNYDFTNHYAWCLTAQYGYTDVVFFVNMLQGSQITPVKDYIQSTSNQFFNTMEYTRVYIIDSMGSILETNDGKICATNIGELNQLLIQVRSTGVLATSNINSAFYNVCQNSNLVYNRNVVSTALNYTCFYYNSEYYPMNETDTTYNIYSASGLYEIELDDPISEDYLEKSKEAQITSSSTLKAKYSDTYADTDFDGIYDFSELLFEYNGKQLINWNENGEVILLSLNDIMSITGDDFAQNGLYQYKNLTTVTNNTSQIFSEVLEKKQYITIKSSPNDSDYNSNGIPDEYDNKINQKELSENGKCIYEDDSLNEIEDEIFYVTDYYKKPPHVKEYVSLSGNNISTFSFPKEDTMYKCGTIPNYKNANLLFGSIIIANGEYWFKVLYNNNWVYLKAADTEDGEKYTAYYDDKKALLSEFNFNYRVTSVSAIPIDNEGLYQEPLYTKNENTSLTASFILTPRDLYVLEFACNSVKDIYLISNDVDTTTKSIISNYLKPELLLAISGAETGFMNANGKDGNGIGEGGGFGIVEGGIKYAISYENGIAKDGYKGSIKLGLKLDGASYNSYSDADKYKKYLGAKACAVMLAHQIYVHINQCGGINYATSPLKSIKDINDNIKIDQLFFNAIYTYGAGTAYVDYYGARTYMGEAGPGTAVKLYAYSIICNKMGIEGFLPIDYSNLDFNELSEVLSNYTNLNGLNQYTFKIDLIK
ncbi:MAG: cellulose binding domain-containing protein [Prevotella sp.]|nr:cellulose binding domain-containing protein [Prevotella sp.]